MNLHHLKVFLAVAEAGSISAGAERLHISQPAVTREIRDLEASLDLRLGPVAHRVRASFLPGPEHTVAERIAARLLQD